MLLFKMAAISGSRVMFLFVVSLRFSFLSFTLASAHSANGLPAIEKITSIKYYRGNLSSSGEGGRVFIESGENSFAQSMKSSLVRFSNCGMKKCFALVDLIN